MTQAKHTPAPWIIDTTFPDGNKFTVSAKEKCRSVAICSFGMHYDVKNDIMPLEAEANARLIAAAPETAAERDHLKAVNADLLEALKAFIKLHDNGLDYSMVPNHPIPLARAAIAKAEGK